MLANKGTADLLGADDPIHVTCNGGYYREEIGLCLVWGEWVRSAWQRMCVCARARLRVCVHELACAHKHR